MTRKMKDSGVEWIGEIPEDWIVIKLKKCADLKTGTTPSIKTQELSEGNLNWFTPVDFNNGLILNNSIRKLNQSYAQDKIVPIYPANSVLIVGIGATLGKVGFIVEEASSNQQITAIMPKKNVTGKYLLYLILAGMTVIKDTALYTTLPILNNQTLGEFNVLDLPIKEQQNIVNYLDNKCNKIDQTIEKEKAVIEKLKEYKQSVITEAVTKGLNPDVKMKDSGVEWIGEIPEHWSIVKLKQVFTFRKGLTITKENLVEKGIKVISYGQIHSKNNNGIAIDDSLIRYVGNEYLETGKQSLVLKNDFIFADTSEDLDGAGNCVFVDLNDEIFAGYHTIILAPIKRESISDWRYFAYLYKTDCWRSQIRSRVSGIKLFSITQKILKQAEIIMPDIKEQQEIIDYLDKKCSAIDKLITNKEKVIEKLTEYKKSLIYECVTGKREV